MNNIIRAALLGFGLCILLTGCWNSRELTNMSIVVGMGIDTDPESGGYQVSFQIVNSGAYPTGSKSGSSGALPVSVYSEKDSSLFGALRKISGKVPRRLFFGHIQLVIIGEKAAQKGIEDLFDFFERSHEVRISSIVLVSRETSAENVLRVVTPLEKTPSVGIARRTDISSKVWAENINVNIADVVNGLVGSGNPVISGVRIEGNPKDGARVANLSSSEPAAAIHVQGIGMFKEGKLIGWLDGPLARGVLWIRNQLKSTVIQLPCGEKNKNTVIVVVRSQTSIHTRMEKGRPQVDIRIKEEGNISETNCRMPLDKREHMQKLQEAWAKVTEEEVLATIKAAKHNQADILGFGESLQQSHPKQWKQVEKDWPRLFTESEVHIQVDAYLRRTGMRSNSYLNELKKNEKNKVKP